MKTYQNWEEVFALAKPMEFNAFNTGHIKGKLKTYSVLTSIPEAIDQNIVLDYDILAFHFKHPEQGDTLIDCGFSKAFSDRPPYGNLSFALKAFQKLNKIRYSQLPGEDFENHLKRLDLKPSNVFLTHLHPDHTSGVPALDSDCEVYFGKKENSFYYRFILGGHLKGKKINLLDFEADGLPLGPFEKVIDVFKDGSLFAISTPGHTVDHIAYLVNSQPTAHFILGDAELNPWAVANGIKINTDYGKKGEQDIYRSSAMIQEFIASYPAVKVHYSHDMEDLPKSNLTPL